ncbi:MAG: hypothetical protein ACFFE8_07575 [Candidatus Heimdallarchaeota archaeon]
MTDVNKVNPRNKMVYGAIAGGIGGAVDIILKFVVTTFNIGKFDDIAFASQQFFGTASGSPNIVGVFGMGIVMWAFVGLIFGGILYLLLTRAGWERNLTRYTVVAFVIGFVLFLATLTYLPLAEWDLLIDLPIQLVIGVGSMVLLAPIVYALEQRDVSAF